MNGIEDHQRLLKINQELNKLSNLIEMTKSQNYAVFEVLKNCQQNTPSSSSSIIIDQRSSSNSISQIFESTDSKNTIELPDNHFYDSFNQNQSSTITKPAVRQSKKSLKKSSNVLHQSNMSSQVAKESQKHTYEVKRGPSTIKKSKLLKNNIAKNKNLLDKEKAFLEQEKKSKINRIKSQKKLLNNNKSSLKYSLNLNPIKQQKSTLKKQKMGKNTPQHTENYEILPQKTYASTKVETLNSKRSKAKYSSLANKQKEPKHMQTMRNSNHKFQIDIQKQVIMKIDDLKLKKTLCQIETNYLTVSLKATKDEIEKTLISSNKNSEQKLMRFFILKSIMKFISQFKPQSVLNFESNQVNQGNIEESLKKYEKMMKVMNKLPDILRKNSQISEFAFKQFTQEKLFIDQNIHNSFSKFLTREPLYTYLQELFQYIEFLLENSLITLIKKDSIVNFSSQGFYSDRSAKRLRQTAHGTKENNIHLSKKNQFSQRKKDQIVPLKRVNTVKALKKSVPLTKTKIV